MTVSIRRTCFPPALSVNVVTPVMRRASPCPGRQNNFHAAYLKNALARLLQLHTPGRGLDGHKIFCALTSLKAQVSCACHHCHLFSLSRSVHSISALLLIFKKWWQ